MPFFSIYDKDNEVIAEKPFPNSGTCGRLAPSWIFFGRSSSIFFVLTGSLFLSQYSSWVCIPQRSPLWALLYDGSRVFLQVTSIYVLYDTRSYHQCKLCSQTDRGGNIRLYVGSLYWEINARARATIIQHGNTWGWWVQVPIPTLPIPTVPNTNSNPNCNLNPNPSPNPNSNPNPLHYPFRNVR